MRRNEEWIERTIGRGYSPSTGDGFLVKLEGFLITLDDNASHPSNDPQFFSPNQKELLLRVEGAVKALEGIICEALGNGMKDERKDKNRKEEGR